MADSGNIGKAKFKYDSPRITENVGRKLTLKQELFCRLYTHNDDLFGNATRSYGKAYGYDLDNLSDEDAVYEDIRDPQGVVIEKRRIRKSSRERAERICSVNGRNLLTNTRVNDYITKLLNELMRDDIVDAEIARTIKQTVDYSAKMRAISEYNKVKKRTRLDVDVTSKGEKVGVISGMQIIEEPDEDDVVEEQPPQVDGDPVQNQE